MNFLQLYEYLVVSTRKYRHIILKGTHYKKLKSYQFFFEGNVKKLESKVFENKAYVRATVLPSMKKTPYRVVVEFAPTFDVLRAACTCDCRSGLCHEIRVLLRNHLTKFLSEKNTIRQREHSDATQNKYVQSNSAKSAHWE